MAWLEYCSNFAAIMNLNSRTLSSFPVLLLITLAWYMWSCRNDLDCTNTASNAARIVFIDTTNGEIASITFDSVLIMNIADTILYDSLNISDTLQLPLDPFNDETMFLFYSKIGDSIPESDSLQLGYSITERLISEDCGAVQVFNNLDTIFHTFDSVYIENPNVRITNEINLRIVL
jgi:hypothetical protein